MSAVARRLQDAERERQSRMTAEERLEEALVLGAAAIEDYAAAHGVDAAEARRRFERNAQAGRRPSRVMREII